MTSKDKTYFESFMIKTGKSKAVKFWTPSILLVIALCLYLAGFTHVFMAMVLVFICQQMPFPKIFSSIFSRLIVSILLFYGIFQLIISFEFILFPATVFKNFSIVVVLVLVLASFLLRKRKSAPTSILNRNDLFATISASLFLVPIMLFCFTHGGVLRTADIGGIQGADGVNHYVSIAQVDKDQRITYVKGNAYPVGFHLTTAFIQDSVGINQGRISRLNGVQVYIAQYLLFGFLLSYSLFYLIKQGMGLIKSPEKYTFLDNIAMSLALGVPLSIFFLYPFLYNGFLHYYYICTTIVLAFIYAIEAEKAERLTSIDNKKEYIFSVEREKVWLVMTYLVLVFGASLSWPLIGPPLILIGVFYVFLREPRKLISPTSYRGVYPWIVIVGFLIQLIPLYFQVIYGDLNAAQGINALGALRTPQYGTLVLGIAITTILVGLKKISENIKINIYNIFIPLYGFISLLALFQFFTVGELRYYVIKVSMLLEILILSLLVGLLSYGYKRSGLIGLRYGIILVALPAIIFMLTMSIAGNPLKDIRSLFRTYSREAKPEYFENDILVYEKLGDRDLIGDFNSMLLHYQNTSGKYFAHPQIPYWQNAMQYGADRNEIEAKNCHKKLYDNLLFGTYTKDEQTNLIATINECANLANVNGHDYYVITDRASVPYVKRVLSKNVKIVW